MIRGRYAALEHEKIGLSGLIDCESLLPHLRTGRSGTEKFLTRHFGSILDALEGGDLGDVAWIPGTEDPADGLTRATIDCCPLYRPLETGIYRPDRMGQLRGASFRKSV